MNSLDLPFLDLFQELQKKGMKLSPEQYNLLRQSLGQGFGLENWDDLRDICRVLWVKPSPNYDASIFEQGFSEYVQKKQRKILNLKPQEAVPSSPSKPGTFKGQLPKVPPRKLPISQSTPKVPVAVKTGVASLPEVDQTGLHLTPTELPLSRRTILNSWQFLRQQIHQGLEYELDLDATIACITQQGYFSDVVMRPVLRKKAELLLLVDDSNVMLPFAPAFQPLVNAIEENRVTPAQIYRFTTYPDNYLYNWRHPSQAILLASLLSRMHPRRTIIIVCSEAGATSQSVNQEQQDGLVKFLVRLSPCIRDLIWLNPLPSERWTGTLAQEVALLLDGRMIHLDAARLLQLAKQVASTVQALW